MAHFAVFLASLLAERKLQSGTYRFVARHDSGFFEAAEFDVTGDSHTCPETVLARDVPEGTHLHLVGWKHFRATYNDKTWRLDGAIAEGNR